MTSVLRLVGAIVAGLGLALALVVGVELFGAVVHPLPADFDNSMEQMCAHVERYPAWVLAVVVPLWAVTGGAGTWLAGRLGNRGCAITVGLLLVTAVVFNVSMLPYPLWFKLAAVIAVLAAAIAGIYLFRPRNTAKLSVAT
jgi:hypothetical protein